EWRAFPRRALYPNLSPRQFDNLLGQGYPKSRSLDLMRIVGPHLAEFLEYLRLILRGDPDAGVTDRNLYRTVCLPGLNSNPSFLRGELHCVGKQIEKNLFDLALIADEVAKTLVNGNVKI